MTSAIPVQRSPPPPPQEWCHVTALPPHNNQLSSAATHPCPQGERCREVGLYMEPLKTKQC